MNISIRKLFCTVGLLFLLLFTSMIAPWPVSPPSVVFAASFHQPKLSPPPWLTAHPTHKTIPLSHPATSHTHPSTSTQASGKLYPVSMPPLTIRITAQTQQAQQQMTGKDGHLEVDLPAHLFSHATLVKAGGAISLQITQILPGSGGLSSNLVFFGTYLFQFLDAHGHSLAQVTLAHPLIIRYHMTTQQTALIVRGQQVYTIWRPGGKGDWLAADATRATLNDSKVVPLLGYATSDKTGRVWSIVSSLSASPHSQLALSPSNLTFGTQAPQAVWAKPQDVEVDLNAGGLTYSYPLTLPPGPGGFTPDLSLSYSSAAVNENHNVQAAAPSVGEGWNISLGSISWAEENVTPGGTNRLENVWNINDANGISGQLIPPDLQTSTIPPYNPLMSSLSQSSPYLWHTAPESHAKVEEMNFGNQPCWRVWLPNGVIEDFGCTNDSRQFYVDSQNNVVQWRWDLDLMIDPHGNQVHIQYQQNHPSDGYVRDAVISSISYDDPGCLNTTSSCSPWNPQVTLTFDSSNVVANLTNSSGGCANWSNSQGYRCDDPVDLSGNGGLPIPKVLTTYVLNDLKVTVNGNLLREYVFSYEQTPPQTITDPSTGQQESIAGYLDLTKIQALGTNGADASAPEVTMSYVSNLSDDVLHYEDSFQLANPPNVCPGWVPIVSGNCLLWSQSYNARFLKVLDNGEGWNETMTWTEAHNNTHGVDSGNVTDPRNCTGQSDHTNLCGYADDQSWGRVVIRSRSAVSNGVTSTWNYVYALQQNLYANFPGACFGGLSCYQGFTWGDQNDADWLDYYNGQFEGFAQAEVTFPDNSTQVYTYAATDGWGKALSTITCYLPDPNSCSVAPFFVGYSNNGQTVYAPVLAGQPLQEDEYDTDGDLLSEEQWSYGKNCPPPGVVHSLNSGGTGSDPGETQLISQLDTNNPVVVCDPRATQEDDYTLDGVTTDLNDPRVVHTTTSYSYDTENKSGASGYDYGNLSLTTESGNDVGGAQLLTMQQYYPNDNIPNSHFLTDLPALSQQQELRQQQDGNGTPWSCSQSVYGNNTGYNAQPTVPDVTQAQSYSVAGSGGCTGTNNLITVQHTYDASGNAITAIDGDGHLGCTQNGNQYSACAGYDSMDTHILTATNALKQTTTYTYATDATGGFGEWLTAETDPNTQTTQYQYDVLGRLTAVIKPGDSPSSPTISYTYINGCSQGETTPCLELDTSTQFVSGGPTSTMRQWYDGWGNLVETQTPAPTGGQTIVTYTIYDVMNRPIVQSLPYAIDTPSGYVTPDQTQPRTVTGYDGLGRSLGTTTYGQGMNIVTENKISYTIGNSVPTLIGDTNPYEQTITVDALNHQSITYTDAFGRTVYTQVFSGTSSYSAVRTVGYTYDPLGDAIETETYDHTGTAQAVYTATYDALKERTGYTDPDLGTWSLTYDADGNLTQQSQIVNGNAAATTSTTYDALDRPLCSWNSVPPAQGTCQQNGNAYYFYDSYDNTSNPTMTFPSGCTAPTGSYASDPIGHATAEVFNDGSSNGNGWYCYGYDQRGETDQETLSVTTPDKQTLTQTMNMSYNDGGELSTLVYPNGEALTTQYDANGRAQSVYFGTPSTPDPVNFLVGQVSYTPWGQISGLAMGGSGPKGSTPTNTFYSTSLSYDAIQRPLSTSATMTGQTQAFFSQTRTYDAIGNVIQLLTTVPTSGGGTANDNQSYCYDDLSRLVWNGNNGTPTGGDHCGPTPTGTTIAYHHQSYSYDDLDRMTSGREGTYTYGDSSNIHAVTNLSDVPNQYAAYDTMGDMTCQNTDTTSAHTCSGSNPTGALMQYDPQGQLLQWTAPSGTTASDSFLYDGEGNRVLQSASSTTTTGTTLTDTITFDNYTESTITDGTTTTINYYSLNGQLLALQQGNNPVAYLITDLLGSVDVAVNAGGTIAAVQLYWPYGAGEYSWGTMPTTYNFTGQRLDSVTGLLYYNARYYDPFSARFTTADTVENNAAGMDPYAYVGDDPVGKKDPTGHDGHDDPVAAAFVEEWYMDIEGTYGILIDQPSDTHNPAIAIRNAAVPGWDGSASGLQNLMSNMPGLIAQGGTNGKGYPDIMNTNLHFIYEVKGGILRTDGSTNSPSDLTVAFGWAQARWYAAMANQDPRWNQGVPWTVGNLAGDPALAVALAACGGVCVDQMKDGRWIALMYAGRGVLTYQVFTSNPGSKTSPEWYYHRVYTSWQELLGRIAIALLAGMAMGGGFNTGSSSPALSYVSYGFGWGGGSCSFSATTVIWTPDGEVPIEQLQVNDQVLSYNPLTHMIEAQSVLHVWEHEDADLVDVSIVPTTQSSVLFAGTPEVIHTTSGHPFLTLEKGFIPVSQLRVGMHVMQANGSVGIVIAIRPVSGDMIMYNLEVAQDHTFIVGEDQWIVHNRCWE